MKINRSDEIENYKITSSWLNEFASELEKKALDIDYLRQYLDSRKNKKTFNTIEEKLADIKERVGFDLARKVDAELNKTTKVSSTSCGCSIKLSSCSCSVKIANKKHSKEDIECMSNILKYIQDMIKHEPHLDTATIIGRCRSEDELGFNNLRIDLEKLTNFISDELKENEKKSTPISYIPKDLTSDTADENSEAEYFSHATPSIG